MSPFWNCALLYLLNCSIICSDSHRSFAYFFLSVHAYHSPSFSFHSHMCLISIRDFSSTVICFYHLFVCPSISKYKLLFISWMVFVSFADNLHVIFKLFVWFYILLNPQTACSFLSSTEFHIISITKSIHQCTFLGTNVKLFFIISLSLNFFVICFSKFIDKFDFSWFASGHNVIPTFLTLLISTYFHNTLSIYRLIYRYFHFRSQRIKTFFI